MLTTPLPPGRARGRRAVPMAWTASPAATTHQTAQAGTGPAAAPKTTLPGMAGLTVCQSSTLKVTMDTSQAGAAMGSAYYPVNFTNTSAAACGLYGYPGMSFVTSAGSGGAQI